MVVSENTNRLVRKQDLVHIAVLLAIALGIGIYLVITTVLIAKDGVFYIERAQKFSNDPIGIIKEHPFGYPFLIFMAHKFVSFFSNGSSLYIWIYSAQSVNLLCRVLSLIPLYFTGKIFVGPRNSFWALLILTLLPYPTEFGSDALRDWPHVFFLACGFWAVLRGAKNRNWWIFGLAGLSAGFGYMIRPVCVQLIVYAIVWLVYCLFRPAKTFSRSKTALATALLIAGFLIPVGPYTIVKGKILPQKLYPIIRSFSLDTGTNETETNTCSYKTPIKYTGDINNRILEATGNLIEKGSANLMYFFVLPWLIGIYYHFQKFATQEEKLLITAFVGLNISFLFLRYCCIRPDLTHRYILPLTVLTIFYIPTGLKMLGDWIVNRTRKTQVRAPEKSQRWFYALLIIGLCICLPKLLRPIRIEKKGHISAINWLKKNTMPEDIIAVPDRRISFYAERKRLIYGKKVPKGAKYVVNILAEEDEKPEFGIVVQEKYSAWVDRREKKKRIVIYEVL